MSSNIGVVIRYRYGGSLLPFTIQLVSVLLPVAFTAGNTYTSKLSPFFQSWAPIAIEVGEGYLWGRGTCRGGGLVGSVGSGIWAIWGRTASSRL